MLLEIITPERIIFKGEGKLVRVPGTLGSFAMMRNHRPIISTLEPGIIKVVLPDDKEQFFELMEPAIVEQHENKISILAECIKESSSMYI
jgi:F-type H+-transporting ATPase subunit epsilon